ncbi:DoxX family protein [Cytobacillus massiliigabonensis]|uniref:DoxX family protein n=1 Tax=Cytobacillus massiliigabonensis TaxID=1871011 RepID=UPI000C843FE5|nr:DoxX family protein [Cytobacillus massiliigabonensis]
MTTAFSAIHLIRYLVAYVFITSGVMKLVSDELGSYFISLGLPFPLYLMYAVSLIEIICGILILANKQVKNAAIPLISIMIAALLLTKIPILHTGFIPFAFNARLDIIMLVLLFILYKRP